MSSLLHLLGAAVLALLLLGLAGCGKTPSKPAAVQGRVSYRGALLPGGTIVFTPDTARGGSGPLARAEIQPDGTYSLRTEDQAGAYPGWYRVTVACFQGAPGTVPRSLLPTAYLDPEMSGLAREVKADQDNTLDINLD
jgi:hypothetical protein